MPNPNHSRSPNPSRSFPCRVKQMVFTFADLPDHSALPGLKPTKKDGRLLSCILVCLPSLPWSPLLPLGLDAVCSLRVLAPDLLQDLVPDSPVSFPLGSPSFSLHGLSPKLKLAGCWPLHMVQTLPVSTSLGSQRRTYI